MKVIIGAFAHESNDFCPNLTTKDMFELYEGQEVIDHLPVRDIFEQAKIEIIPSIYATAPSYGLVDETAFFYLENKILDAVRENPDVDGIWMYCHGAMNVKNIGSGEYRLVCDIRKLIGDKCVISFGMDLHGNLEPDFANKVNIYRCFHTAPHTDYEDTFRRTAKALVNYLNNNYRLYPQMRKLPMIFPGEMAATTIDPFKSIISLMKKWEEEDERIACVSTFIGFAWTDAPRTSSAVVVVPAAPEYERYCSDKADELANLVFSRRKEFDFEMTVLPPKKTAMVSLYEMESPVCVTDMGDNPTAGTTGGSLVLLNEYLEIDDSTKKVLIAGIMDDKAVSVCKGHKPGDTFMLNIGIDIDEITRPITIEITYLGLYDVYGYDIDTNPPIKRCEGVMVSTGNIDILITDKAYAFIQKVNFTSCNIDISDYNVFVTKFGYIFPDLKDMCKSYIMSNTPGESYQMVSEFNYTYIKRPIYPIDDI